MKRWLLILRNKAEKANLKNILSLLSYNPNSALLDCGCGDGENTLKFASKIGTQNIFGIEIVEDLIYKAKQKGINVKQADLNKKFPFADGTIDVVIANQVIEHFYDTDNFIDEVDRVLKLRGGYAVISTENSASWHNIFSLLLGWQPFSLTNISIYKSYVGNPLALQRNENLSLPSSWQHLRVFAYKGLREIFEIHRFQVEKILGAGYYPLPNFVAKVDLRHSAFLTIKVKKV